MDCTLKLLKINVQTVKIQSNVCSLNFKKMNRFLNVNTCNLRHLVEDQSKSLETPQDNLEFDKLTKTANACNAIFPINIIIVNVDVDKKSIYIIGKFHFK